MPNSEKLAERIRAILAQTKRKTEEKRMFVGLCFMVDGKMCVGVESERLMVRLDRVMMDTALQQNGARPMDFTGRVMKGYVFVDIASLRSNKQLLYWMELALDYNKIAKASKKRKL